MHRAPKKIGRFARSIAISGKLTADVIGLEEVRDLEHASLAVQPLSGFKVDVCSNFPPREGQQEAQQVAIASRLQPVSAWAEAWKPGGAITPPRGFAFAAYQLSPTQVLLVYALHLKSNRGEIHEDMRIREESMHQLLSHMKAMKDTYGKMGALTWIVGGDFNTAPDEPRFAGEKLFPIYWRTVSVGPGKESPLLRASRCRPISVIPPPLSIKSFIAARRWPEPGSQTLHRNRAIIAR